MINSSKYLNILKFNLLLIFALFIIYNTSYSQLTEDKALNFKIDKNINTFKFNSLYVDYLNFSFGNFHINQDYSGTALLGATKSIREEEKLLLNFNTKLYNNFYYSTNQNLLLYSDPKATDNNELIRLSTTHGIRYTDNYVSGQLLAGIESNKQFNITETGLLIEPSAYLNGYSYGGYVFNGAGIGSLLKLNDDRKNNKFLLQTSVAKNFNDDDYLNFIYMNDYHDRDILTRVRGLSNDNNEAPAVENILDKKNNLIFSLGMELFEGFMSDINVNYGNVNVNRYYENVSDNSPTSLIKKNYTENFLNLKLNTIYRSDRIQQNTGLEFNTRNERNEVAENGNITPVDLERQISLEKQRDNNSNRTRIFSNTDFLLSKDYTVFLKYSASIFQYNTPSDKNNDDRDLSSYFIETGLQHTFSPILTGSIAFKYDNSHIIFLKSARSGSNYQNKIFSLKPNVQIKAKKLVMRPQIELLANYTIYDYDDLTSGVRSFSFRQIAYNDSVYLHLSKKIGLYSRIVLKYYERGTLFWDDFSETPELSSTENFIKIIAFVNEISKSFNGLNIGIGFRYYTLKQEGLRQSNFGSNFDRISYGPETVIQMDFISGTQLIFNGWYEYQYKKNKFIRRLPNFYLRTKVDI